jgi:hypothetical protein
MTGCNVPKADIAPAAEVALAYQLGKGLFVERLNQWMTLIANIGVVAGIVFLAYETRVNTNAVRSSTYAAFNETANSYYDFQGQHASALGEIFADPDQPNVSTLEQFLLLDALMMKSFNSMEAFYLHHRAGSLDDDVYAGKVAGFRKAMVDQFTQEQWARLRSNGFSTDFQRFMETEIIGTQGDDNGLLISR